MKSHSMIRKYARMHTTLTRPPIHISGWCVWSAVTMRRRPFHYYTGCTSVFRNVSENNPLAFWRLLSLSSDMRTLEWENNLIVGFVVVFGVSCFFLACFGCRCSFGAHFSFFVFTFTSLSTSTFYFFLTNTNWKKNSKQTEIQLMRVRKKQKVNIDRERERSALLIFIFDFLMHIALLVAKLNISWDTIIIHQQRYALCILYGWDKETIYRKLICTTSYRNIHTQKSDTK